MAVSRSEFGLATAVGGDGVEERKKERKEENWKWDEVVGN